jgi:hypothetical protein
VLSFTLRIWRQGEHVEHRINYTTGQGRDFQTDSSAAFARRHWSEAGEESGTGEGTTAQNISSRQEKNCRCTAGTMGEDQSSEEVTKPSICLALTPLRPEPS